MNKLLLTIIYFTFLFVIYTLYDKYIIKKTPNNILNLIIAIIFSIVYYIYLQI